MNAPTALALAFMRYQILGQDAHILQLILMYQRNISGLAEALRKAYGIMPSKAIDYPTFLNAMAGVALAQVDWLAVAMELLFPLE